MSCGFASASESRGCSDPPETSAYLCSRRCAGHTTGDRTSSTAADRPPQRNWVLFRTRWRRPRTPFGARCSCGPTPPPGPRSARLTINCSNSEASPARSGHAIVANALVTIPAPALLKSVVRRPPMTGRLGSDSALDWELLDGRAPNADTPRRCSTAGRDVLGEHQHLRVTHVIRELRSLSSPVRHFVFEFSERRPPSYRLAC